MAGYQIREKMLMIAIIRTGGKQYLVEEGKKYKFEKLEGEIDAVLNFETLLIWDGKEVAYGTPILGKAKVSGKVVAQDRHDKVTGVKHKAKKRELTRYGHRQAYTEVEITKVAA